MRKKLIDLISIVFVFFTLLVASCSKSTEVGLDLLDQDQVGVTLIDTLKLSSISVRQDSVISPDSKNYLRTYPFGSFDDPEFGKTTAGFSMQMYPAGIYSVKDLAGAVVDSVVLSLKYDSLAFGDITQPRKLGVYRVTDVIPSQDHYSNTTFATEATPLAIKDFIPKIKYVRSDSVNIIAYGDTSKLKLPPHLRIRLGKEIGYEFLALDSTKLNTNAEFGKIFKGFSIKPMSEDKGLINFYLTKYDASSTTFNALTNLYVYFRDNKGKKNILTLYAGSTAIKAVNFDYKPSAKIKQAIGNQAIGDSVVYVQGMNGADIQITIPKIKTLSKKNLIVNKAELEVFVKPTADGFVMPPQLLIRKKNIGSIDKDVIDDVLYANNASATLAPFGGKPEKVTINGVTLLRYKFNLSAHAQKMIDDDSINDSFFVTFESKSSSIGRAVIYGAKHSKYPMNFKMYCTKI